MKGWRYESHRHMLAAKGMRSRRYMSPFVEKTTIPAIDYPEEFNSFREKSVVRMSPDEFLKLAKKTSENSAMQQAKHSSKPSPDATKLLQMSQEDYEKMIRSEHKVDRIKEGLQQGKNIPAGHIEFEHNSNVPAEHEGRHRAMAARELGMEEIPVVLVRSRELKKPENGGFGMGHWVYGEEEEYGDKKKILPFTYRAVKAGRRR
jgi:hypothetical protein